MRREQVLWFGGSRGKSVDREFVTRDLTVETVEPEAWPDIVVSARAAVFAFAKPEDIETFGAILRDRAGELADNGVLIVVTAADDALLAKLQTYLGTSPALKIATIRTAPTDYRIAEDVARYDVGPVANLDLVIEHGNGAPPVAQDVRLLQRAFHDCSRIDLVELAGGRSGAKVYAVHMTVAGSDAGTRPQPAFAKIGPTKKIREEFEKYKTFAERYVPFGMRPNLKDIHHGNGRSVLVGDFVEGSISLWDVARQGTAKPAIFSLIEETLAGWRDQGYEAPIQRGSVALQMSTIGIIDPARIVADFVDWSGEEGPATIWRRLTMHEQDFRLAPAHGDLNGENVRVRDNNKAILIDFASVTQNAPTTTDIAHLETWLAFEVPEDRRLPDGYGDPQWLLEIEKLYAPDDFETLPGPCAGASPYKWMWDTVRQVRQAGLATQTSRTEYATAVAVQLLRRCQWCDGSKRNKFRRTQGYRLAAGLSRAVAQ